MHVKPQSESKEQITQNRDEPLGFLDNGFPNLPDAAQADLIQSLLYQIIRVKELVKYYESVPNNVGQLGTSILNELVSEAYNSLVNYDIELMTKYYDLLQNCD